MINHSVTPQSAGKVNFLKKKLMLPLSNFLKQGVSPEKLSMAAALGLTFGIFPILGSTTIICAIFAVLFRVNQPAVQLVNYFVYPLQLILVIPFINMGELLFKAQHSDYSISSILGMFQKDAFHAFNILGQSLLHAVVAWTVTAPFLGILIYCALLPVFKKLPLNK